MLNSKAKDYLVLLSVAGTVIALDQWTKWLVRENIEFGGQWLPDSLAWLFPYARIVHWYNSGAAFGMFQNGNLIFTVLAFIVIGAILYYYPRVEALDWTLKLAMGLQLAGAGGNLIDRLMRGKVTDFISIGAFPVFNVADASISIGVAVLLLGVWINERQEKKLAALKEISTETSEEKLQAEPIVPAEENKWMTQTFYKKYSSLLLVVSIVVFLDQLSKWMVRMNIPLNGSWLPDGLAWLAPYARFVFIYNKGAAFGMFQNGNVFFAIVAILVAAGILYFYGQIDPRDWPLRLASGLYLGGVLGNLIDRLTMGQVTDFISVGTFYIFNVADASINIGVALLLIGYWRSERMKANHSSADEMLSNNGETS